MDNIVYTSVGQLCSSISDTFNGSSSQVVLINTSDVLEGKVLNHQKQPNKGLKGQFKKTFLQEDILYSEIRPQNKRFAFVDFPSLNYIASTKLMVIRADKSKVHPRFLYYFLTCSNVIGQLQQLAETRSGTFPQITFAEISRLQIPLISLQLQRKIASFIECIDEKIETNERINHNLQELTQSVYTSYFIKYNDAGGTRPSNWKQGILGDFVEVKRGGSPRPIQEFLSETGLRWLKISDATSIDAPYILEIKEHIKESGLSKTVFLKEGSLVLSNSATPGIPKILDVDTCIHDGWLYFVNSVFSNEFMYLFFNNIRTRLVELGNGSIFTNLKIDIVKNFPIEVPDTETLTKFDLLVKPLFREMLNRSRENQRLMALRDALLPRLMSGELDVSKVQL